MPHHSATPLSGRRVLVVEDEFLIALDAERIFEDAGASEVLLAKSIEEAEAVLASGVPIDIGVLDLKVGAHETWPLIEDMKRRGIPLVLATGFDPGREVEGVILIQKPYNDETILAIIRTLLTRPDEPR